MWKRVDKEKELKMPKCEIEGCSNKHYAKGLCHKHYRKQYYQDNKEHIAKQIKQYRQGHKEYFAEYNKQYRQGHKEYFAKRDKRYAREHKEYIAKRDKQYYQDHKEYFAEWQKRYAQDNEARIKKYQKQWCQTLVGKASRKASKARRRALTKDLKTATILRIYNENIKKYGVLTCYLCFKPIIDNDDCLEHSTPVTREGSNKYENLGIAHKSCNSKKYTKTLEEWYIKQGIFKRTEED